MTGKNLSNFNIYKSAIVEIITMMMALRFDDLVASGRAYPDSAEECKKAIVDYANSAHHKKLSDIPTVELDKINIFSSQSDKTYLFTIDVPLWFDEVKSDLFAVFCVPYNND